MYLKCIIKRSEPQKCTTAYRKKHTHSNADNKTQVGTEICNLKGEKIAPEWLNKDVA